jgi:LPXTG-motif cell wall-anchored protein
MKFSTISNLIGAGVIAASVATVPFNLPASAQTNTAPDTTTTTTTQQGVDNTDNNNDFDWGWLGLLGLGGLAGLAGRKRREQVGYNDPDRVRSTTYR